MSGLRLYSEWSLTLPLIIKYYSSENRVSGIKVRAWIEREGALTLLISKTGAFVSRITSEWGSSDVHPSLKRYSNLGH